MSKKVKQALGVAAAIAIPYYAGMGLLAGSLTGGTIGAITAKETGGDWRKGALIGGTLGFGGAYAQGAAAGTTGTAGMAGTPVTAPAAPAPTGPAAMPGLTGGPALPTSAVDTSGMMTQLSSPASLEGAVSGTTTSASVPTDTSGFLSNVGGGMRNTSVIDTTSSLAEPGFFSGVSETLGGPSVYVPAGISLASGYMGEKRAEEAEAAQQAEIRRQQQQQEAVFARQQALAESLAQQAEATNPEYFGLQSARRAQAAGAMATRAAEEATPFYKPGLRMAEKRRGELATARGTGTAYDIGYGAGVKTKADLTESAIRSMSQAPSSGLASFYGTQAAGQRQAGMDVGRLFGDIYSRYDQAQQRRLDEERNRILEDEFRRQRGSV